MYHNSTKIYSGLRHCYFCFLLIWPGHYVLRTCHGYPHATYIERRIRMIFWELDIIISPTDMILLSLCNLNSGVRTPRLILMDIIDIDC